MRISLSLPNRLLTKLDIEYECTKKHSVFLYVYFSEVHINLIDNIQLFNECQIN